MNDEIMILLENLQNIVETIDIRPRSDNFTNINDSDIKLLLDYITNLQQNYDRIYNENCKLREEHNISDISLLDENYKLQQENERLKKDCQLLYKNGNKDYLELEREYIDYQKQAEKITIDLTKKWQDYKSRCKKAYKIVESYELGKYDYSIPPGGIIELKDCLKGYKNNE